MKRSQTARPGETAQKFLLEHKQVLSANYLLFLPHDYDAHSDRRWPLIFFLHGIGERGTNVRLVTRHGPPRLARKMTNFPFIVVSPQCPPHQRWADAVLLALLNDVENKYAVDPRRVYLTGLSMGGFGAWDFGLRYPGRFAAMAPMSSGGDIIDILMARYSDLVKLNELRSLGVWAFHGGKDTTVPPSESQHMVQALKSIGCKDVKLTIFPDAKHDCWDRAYSNPELYTWFLRHAR